MPQTLHHPGAAIVHARERNAQEVEAFLDAVLDRGADPFVDVAEDAVELSQLRGVGQRLAAELLGATRGDGALVSCVRFAENAAKVTRLLDELAVGLPAGDPPRGKLRLDVTNACGGFMCDDALRVHDHAQTACVGEFDEVEQQVVLRLHSINDSARDVIDLLLLRDLSASTGSPALAEVRQAARAVFAARTEEATQLGLTTRAWPPIVVAHPHWVDDFTRAATSGGVRLSLDGAVDEVNAWIKEIELVGLIEAEALAAAERPGAAADDRGSCRVPRCAGPDNSGLGVMSSTSAATTPDVSAVGVTPGLSPHPR